MVVVKQYNIQNKFDMDCDFKGAQYYLAGNDYEHISKLLYDICGIYLGANKISLVESRLASRLRDLKMQSFKEYLEFIKTYPSEIEILINKITTNKTDFFREKEHFDFLVSDILPNIITNKKYNKKFRVWSAACSTGEEVYTLAIVLNEFFSNHLGWDYKILGTDINTQVLDYAQKGIYKKDVVMCIPPYFLNKYFDKVRCLSGQSFAVKEFLKHNVKFRYFNLLQSIFNVPIKFDVIFLRNVLIYFDNLTIEKVINKMWSFLNPAGYLFVGHSESLTRIRHKFKQIKGSIYQKD